MGPEVRVHELIDSLPQVGPASTFAVEQGGTFLRKAAKALLKTNSLAEGQQTLCHLGKHVRDVLSRLPHTLGCSKFSRRNSRLVLRQSKEHIVESILKETSKSLVSVNRPKKFLQVRTCHLPEGGVELALRPVIRWT
jgi:hypothetical protein